MPIKYSCECGACTAMEPFSRITCEQCGTPITLAIGGEKASELMKFSMPFTFTLGNTKTDQEVLDESLKRGHEYINRSIREGIGNCRGPLDTHHCICGETRGLFNPNRKCRYCGRGVVIPYG